VVEGRRRSLSNVLKGSQIEKIPVEPYNFREVAKGDPPTRPDSAVFRGLNEENSEPEDSSTTLSPDPVEIQEMNRERIAQVEREAYEKAFKLGEKTGVERGEQMFRSAVQTFVGAAEELKRMQQEFYRRVEGEIVDLVIATTQKVIQREVDVQKDMILGILKEAIAKVTDREQIRVRISPSDFDLVRAHKSDIVQAIDGIKHLVIQKDEAISRGGAIVETDHGTIDARIEQRFSEVEKALRHQTAEKTGSRTETRPLPSDASD
jgi:flagellar assembly protein FliH